MSAAPLFILAVDHRRSFERLFGVAGPVDTATFDRLSAAKVLVVDAIGAIRAERPGIEGLAVLLDDHYGAAAFEAARRGGLTVALAFERSGLDVVEFAHDDWRERLTGLAGDSSPPGIAKVLIRHRADGDDGDLATQLARLREISDACAARNVPFLLELLTPFREDELAARNADELENVVRPRLVVDAIAQIQDAGVEADVWKVEGISDPQQCEAVAARARAGGRDDVGVVALGAGAPADTVNTWLRSAALGGYSGFAVGRSIWADAVRDHDAGVIDATSARRHIASNYLRFVDAFTGSSSGPE